MTENKPHWKNMFPSLSEVRCVFFEVPNITTCRVWTSAQTPFWEKAHGKHKRWKMNWIASGLNSPIQKPKANSGATRTARVFATGTCEQCVKIQNSWWESINDVFMLITVHSVTRKICPHLRKFLDEMINLNEGVGTLQDIVESRKRRSMKQETAAYQYYREARKLLWVLSSGCSIFWFLQKQKCTGRNNRNFCY